MVACIAQPILSRTSHTEHTSVSKYAHIHRAFVSLEKLRWSRITLSGNVDPHPHSFVRDGNDKQTVENLILFMIIEDPVLICSIYHRSPTHMGESSPMTLQRTTVIDANGRCTQRYDGARPTDTFRKCVMGSRTWPGTYRSAGPRHDGLQQIFQWHKPDA
ncbi:hypothetical protein EDD22DRAFT_851640 [Suillus occidentalis]|nr:hypothetical protein EDD22DRAFT_851640 [Suillus occidentalis]